MLAKKNITTVIALLMAAAVSLCICAVGFSGQITAAADAGITMEYESKLFDTDEVLGVNILMEQSEWEEMLQNAAEEKFYDCDVEIGGKTFSHVGIRPKGNTSLSAIVNDPDTDRYSFKLKFDYYIEGQTCFGLDELILNNNYADATNMKEALIYDMFAFVGADASLYNYAKISVNGEYWGIYLALEAVNESFLLRNYGTQSGSLYKPEGEIMGGFGSSGSGANLNYTDDSLDSYSAIWDGAVNRSTSADHTRVVVALKNIFQGTDLESNMDTDNLLRYMAVHVFAVNEDSLSGNMAHNYYLYESNGKLNLLPWDYNLSFGGMGGRSNASGVINSPIEDPFSGTQFFDALLDDEEYHARYAAYLQKIAEEYVAGGGFDAFYTRVRSQIDDLVASDPTAFYTDDEYLTAADTLYQVVKLRGQSISGQLDGTIPSDARSQTGSDALIDGEDLSISAMGTMNAGGGKGGDFANAPDAVEAGAFPQNFQPPQGMENMQPPMDGNFPELPEGMEFPQFAGIEMNQGAPSVETQSADTQTENTAQGDFEAQPDQRQAPGDFQNNFPGIFPGDFPGTQSQSAENTARNDNLIWYAVSLAVLLAAFTIALCFRRKVR